MIIYIIWLIGVILWNFVFPNVIPIADVIASILLSFFKYRIKKVSKILINQMKNKYSENRILISF